jgi:Tol biopolymer transport system component
MKHVPLHMMLVLLITTIALVSLARLQPTAWLVYVARDEQRAVFLTTANGRSHRQLTPDAICGNHPRFSPDSRWIALTSVCSGTNNLYRMRATGLGLQSLDANLPYMVDIQWSPQGNRLLMKSNASDLYLTNALGNDARLIASGYYHAQWSPDGHWIYARPHTEGQRELQRIHAETGITQHLLSAPTITNLSWSPNGSQIALGMGRNLILMAAQDSTWSRIPVDLPFPRIAEPVWSPDGAWIAFFGGPSVTESFVYRVRSDGSDFERLTQESGNLQDLQWSPDGAWLIFTSDYDGLSHIFRLRADGALLENMTPGSAREDDPQFAPVAGLDWRPLWSIIAAGVMFITSLVSRRGLLGNSQINRITSVIGQNKF